MKSRLLFLSLGLCAGLLAFGLWLAQPNAAMRTCLEVRELLPAPLRSFRIDNCEIGNFQTTVGFDLNVPAAHVLDVEAFLVTELGMGELKFVCCHYETGMGGGTSIPIPEGHRLYVPYRDIGINMGAAGVPGNAGRGLEFLELGEADATVWVRISDA